MIRFLAVLVALLPLSCSSCNPIPAPLGPVPAPVVVADADVPLEAGRPDACSKMCVNLRGHSCSDGKPTTAGASCETVCRTNQANAASRLTAKFLACVAAIKACADEDSCSR